jgi:FkbM family methyltransferase
MIGTPMSETFKETSDNTALYELESILHSLVANDTTILDALTQMLGTLHEVSARIEEGQAKLNTAIVGLMADVRALILDRVGHSETAREDQTHLRVVAGDGFARENPEVGLLKYLYSFLSDTNAIDVGAHVGSFSEQLLDAGYAVYAFEPYPPSFESLYKRLQSNPAFHAFQLALGRAPGQMDLHIASDLSGVAKRDATLYNSLVLRPLLQDLQFTGTVSVAVSSIERLIENGTLPRKAGLLKVDAEAYDLEVLRGLGNADIDVVMTEFWDPAHAFGVTSDVPLRDLVAEMRPRGYQWHIVVYHLDEEGTISYYCNRTDTVRGSWGNVLFFRDRSIFMRAFRWCEEVIPATLHR